MYLCMFLVFGHSRNHAVQYIKQTEMHCVGWQPTVSPISLCYPTEHCAVFFMCFCLSLWSLSCHQLASCVNIFPVSAQPLSLYLLQHWSDSQSSVMWQPCHSDEWLSTEAECRCEMSTRATPKSKRTVRLAQPWIPTVSSDHGSAEASEEIKGENIRQKEEQRSNRAWWKGAAWGLGLMSLTSPHGLQGRTPLKWVNFAPVITAQIQQSQISLSISHQRIESLRESWLTEDIVLKWAVSLSLSLPSAHQTLSVTFPDGLCNAETEQLWQENIRNVSVILQDNQKRQKRWKIGKDRFR